MPEQLLNLLKLCLLVLLYLFFLRVVRAVWVEVNGPRLRRPAAAPQPAAVSTSAGTTSRPSRRKRTAVVTPGRSTLVVVAPAEQVGRSFPLEEEITVGRAAGCQVTLDDSYASQLHARVFLREGQVHVEDLGSTNGTYLNREKVSGALVVKPGDRIQIGSTVLELRT